MARPRKPMALHVISGSAAHNPARFADRANEPQCADALGPPPAKMKAAVRACWLEIERLAPWLRSADRLAVEVAASLLEQFRHAGVTRFTPQLLTRLESMLGRLGLTPSDRSKVKDPGSTKPENRFLKHRNRP
jgi:hypothetical protein